MGRIVDVEVSPDDYVDEPSLRKAAARAAGMRTADVRAVRVRKKSIDARRSRVRIRASIEVFDEPPPEHEPVRPIDLPQLGTPRVAIVGSGPAGLFCAWRLAQHGIGSVVLERGQAVPQRRRDVADLSARGELHPESNYCYGEGGAGTFSDGKLYTRALKRGNAPTVLEALVAYGAPHDVRVDARPHIGTNRLPAVITTMRAHLESAGVEFEFGARVTALQIAGDRVSGVSVGGRTIDVPTVVLATGHSARDVPRFAASAGATVTAKSFAIGLRLEHPQATMDRLQYGRWAGHPALGPASYRLVEHAGDVSVFSFCMCPGGHMVPATTEPDAQVVNGWSPSRRQGRFANSGFVTEVGARQIAEAGLDPDDAFAGVQLQRRYEQEAYAAGGGAFVAPAQRLMDFIAGEASRELPECSYPRGTAAARLDELLGPLAVPIVAALRSVGERMPEYLGPEAIAVGVESRTSSPVRIDRDAESLQSPTLPGLYPGGEGAGYAGGIMSAALDGIRIANAIARDL